MLIYEKENKLNINFDNEVSEQPDLQISKEDGKTSVKIDGQESGGGSGGSNDFYFKITENQYNDQPARYRCDKTFAEIEEAYISGKILHCIISVKMEGLEGTRVYDPIIDVSSDSTIRITYVGFDPPIDSDPIINYRCYLFDTNGIKMYFKSL